MRNEDWERLVERAYVATDEPLEVEQTTPVEKETQIGEVQTLNSKEKLPLAESTRKDFREPKQKENTTSTLISYNNNNNNNLFSFDMFH